MDARLTIVVAEAMAAKPAEARMASFMAEIMIVFI